MITQGEALALTLAVELPVGMLCLRFGHPVPRDVVRRVLAIAAASLITHPLAWASNQRLAGTFAFPVRATIIEIGVALVEMLLLRFALRIPWWLAAITAVVANAASFGIGQLLRV